MEPLLRQLRELPQRLASLPAGTRRALIGGVAALALVAVVVAALVGRGEPWQYVFTNLSTEDSTEAAASLKTANIPFRLEANGAALAVPASKVYDARLLLASAGLPRGGGVGFELFDRGDLGVSEFTQRVNLRRAIEGELARTIGRLDEVRAARVHVTLGEKGLFRGEERKASAAVVLNLRPGRNLGERQLAGVRHLVASAVPGLEPDAVTIVDGRGGVLASERDWADDAAGHERKIESELEARIIGLLEPAVGAGSVVARVDATLDASAVDTQQETFDPDSAVVRSERKVNQAQDSASPVPGGVAGAAANQPMAQAATTNGAGRGSSTLDDETRNYEINKTVTKTITRAPRLRRLSVAILLDGVNGAPRPEAELSRLGELAKSAIGFDAARGDQLQISSAPFTHSADEQPVPEVKPWALPKPLYWAVPAAVLLLAAAAFFVARRRRASAAPTTAIELRPGVSIAELEAESAAAHALPAAPPPPVVQELPPAIDPVLALRDRARELAMSDPARAVHLLRAWMEIDPAEPVEVTDE